MADDDGKRDARWHLSPLALLAAQTAAVILIAFGLGWCQVRTSSDSDGYVKTSQMPWPNALLSTRTPGYPLVLKVVACFSPQYQAIPWLHFASLAACVFFLNFALRRFGASSWAACVASSGFLYAAVPLRSPVAYVLTDFLAMVTAVAAVACVFWLAARRRQPLAWLGLLLAVTATYQIRPAYLFLVPLVPCLGVLFGLLHGQSAGGHFAWKGFLAALALVCFGPLLAYCSLRRAVVGDFGLVSFGGYNLSGLAWNCWIETSSIMNCRNDTATSGAGSCKSDRGVTWNQPSRSDSYVNMRRYEDNFSVNIYDISVPAARQLFGDDPLELNRALTDFSRQVIGLRKGKFLLWALYLYVLAQRLKSSFSVGFCGFSYLLP